MVEGISMIDRRLPAVVIAAWIVAACGSNTSSSPLTPTPMPTPAASVVRSLTVTGNTSLTAIGQTSQLTATAVSSDGMRKDVTSDTQWVSLDSSVATISSSGSLTSVHLGATSIQASYQEPTTGTKVYGSALVTRELYADALP
jgi:hypothetical protein